MKNWTIRTKLIFGFAAITLMALLIGLLGFVGISRINYQNRIGALANDILVDTVGAQSNALRFIIYGEEQFYREMEETFENILAQSDQAAGLMKKAENRENNTRMRESAENYLANNSDYYAVDTAMKESGAVRVQRAGQMISTLIDVIAAAKDFTYTTEISSRGSLIPGEKRGGAGLADAGSAERDQPLSYRCAEISAYD